MAFPITSAGILIHDNRDNYWLTLEKSGKISIPGGKRDKGEGVRACAIRETSEETHDSIRSQDRFKRALYSGKDKKVDKKTVREVHFLDPKIKAINVTYVIQVDLHKDHDPAQTFAKKLAALKADPNTPAHKLEVAKLIPVKSADLIQALKADRPEIQGNPVRYCVAQSLKELFKDVLIAPKKATDNVGNTIPAAKPAQTTIAPKKAEVTPSTFAAATDSSLFGQEFANVKGWEAQKKLLEFADNCCAYPRLAAYIAEKHKKDLRETCRKINQFGRDNPGKTVLTPNDILKMF